MDSHYSLLKQVEGFSFHFNVSFLHVTTLEEVFGEIGNPASEPWAGQNQHYFLLFYHMRGQLIH